MSVPPVPLRRGRARGRTVCTLTCMDGDARTFSFQHVSAHEAHRPCRDPAETETRPQHSEVPLRGAHTVPPGPTPLCAWTPTGGRRLPGLMPTRTATQQRPATVQDLADVKES